MKKKCRRCGSVKKVEGNYYKNSRRKDGYDSLCKLCWRKIDKERCGKRNDEQRVKRLYNMTYNDKKALIEKQNGLCALEDCSNNLNKRGCIDHDHTTGLIRGILCVACNVYLGYHEKGELRGAFCDKYLMSPPGMYFFKNRWDKYFLELAEKASEKSGDPDTKVGAVIRCGSIIVEGCNHFPNGVVESVDRWKRPQKYTRVLHAEMDAILKMGNKSKNGTIYVTHDVCPDCAKVIIQCGIKEVVSGGGSFSGDWKEKTKISISMFAEAGVGWRRHK